ncbi:MAG: cytochrome c [Blastocatellia bacterium]
MRMKLSSKELKKVVVGAFTLSFLALAILFQASSQAAITTAADGAATFKAKCTACHGADGSGNTAAGKSLKVRDLRSAEVQKQSDEQLFNIIAKGKGKMTGYQKTLGAEKCKEQVAFIRHLAGK